MHDHWPLQKLPLEAGLSAGKGEGRKWRGADPALLATWPTSLHHINHQSRKRLSHWTVSTVHGITQ